MGTGLGCRVHYSLIYVFKIYITCLVGLPETLGDIRVRYMQTRDNGIIH